MDGLQNQLGRVCRPGVSGDEEIQERVKIPVDETDSAEVVGSNPTGPTTTWVYMRHVYV